MDKNTPILVYDNAQYRKSESIRSLLNWVMLKFYIDSILSMSKSSRKNDSIHKVEDQNRNIGQKQYYLNKDNLEWSVLDWSKLC